MEVAGADHLVVDDHVDSLLAVPLLALPVVDHWHVDHLRARNIMDYQVDIVKLVFQHWRPVMNYQRFYNIQALQSHPDQKYVGMKTDDEKDGDNDDVDGAHNMCVVCRAPSSVSGPASFLPRQ